MGLDQTVYKIKKNIIDDDFVVDICALEYTEIFNDESEIGYWRKFWGLHRYMEALAYKKGMKEYYEERNSQEYIGFNDIMLRLTAEDIKELKKDIVSLTGRFCESIWEPKDERKKLKKFVAEAEKILKQDEYNLYYMSSY